VALTLTQPEGGEKVVGLLSNPGSHWYVVDYCDENKLLAIPNVRVEKADAQVEEPSIIEDG
jgi:hypothetical protein